MIILIIMKMNKWNNNMKWNKMKSNENNDNNNNK